jgi:arginine/ornithine N-succinyltransferase beta subunit
VFIYEDVYIYIDKYLYIYHIYALIGAAAAIDTRNDISALFIYKDTCFNMFICMFFILMYIYTYIHMCIHRSGGYY